VLEYAVARDVKRFGKKLRKMSHYAFNYAIIMKYLKKVNRHNSISKVPSQGKF